MNELKADFIAMINDIAIEYEVDLTDDLVEELYSQCVALFGDCQDNIDE
jgi:hypothetical protein